MNTLIEVRNFTIIWYNLPFTLALFAFLCLSLLQFIGLDEDVDADADFEADLEFEVDDLLDWAELLQFLGIRRVPITMISLLLLGAFGVSGWILNSLILSHYARYPYWAIVPVVLISLLAAGWFTSRAGRFIGRVVPAITTSATSVERLVSRKGRVISAQVDESYGQVQVRDAGGTLITVFAIVDPGQSSIIYDSDVFLVEYDPQRKVFIVEPSEL